MHPTTFKKMKNIITLDKKDIQFDIFHRSQLKPAILSFSLDSIQIRDHNSEHINCIFTGGDTIYIFSVAWKHSLSRTENFNHLPKIPKLSYFSFR